MTQHAMPELRERAGHPGGAPGGQELVGDDILTPMHSTHGRSGARAVQPSRPTPSVLVVIPAFNESRLISRTFRSVASFARKHPSYSFLFVNDGSTDETASILRRLIDHHHHAGAIGLLNSDENRGKGHAVRAGCENAKADIVCFTDGDLAYSLEHLPRLVHALE